jgi:serine/threonine protein kinase
MSKNQRKRLRDKLKTSPAAVVPTKSEYDAYCAEILKLEQFKTSETLNRTKNLIVKVADLGNGCLVNKHNSSDITTRQYRSPEVLLGYSYSTPVDIFSCGAMFFELATGHVLFQPASNRDSYLRNEDHLSLIYRTTGYMPRHLIKEGKYSNHYFNRRCEFLHNTNLQPRPLIDLLKRYHCAVSDLPLFADFLSKCIEPDPHKRWNASQLKAHPWLSDISKSFQERGMAAFHLN